MSILIRTAALLTVSNLFMTFAWYAHLRDLNDKSAMSLAVASWGIALFEYLFQVPANPLLSCDEEIHRLEKQVRECQQACFSSQK